MTSSYSLTRKACYISYTVQALCINIAPLFFVIFKRDYGLKVTDIAFLVLFSFIIQLITDVASIKLIKSLGYKKSAVSANLTAFIGLVLLSVLPRYIPIFPALIVSSFLYSVGAGLVEVVINAIMDSFPTENGAVTFTILHSFYCWGQTAVILISTFLIFLVGEGNWFFIPVIWSIIPLANAVLFIVAPTVEVQQTNEKADIKNLLRSTSFVMLFVVMICVGSSEMVISQWASYFAETGLGVSKVVGDLMGPCIFAFMMAVGRTLYSFFGHKIPIVKALHLCALFATLAYVGISVLESPLAVICSFALAGLSVSVMWPGTLAATSSIFDKGKTSMFALLALAGDLGCSVGPWVNGIVNDAANEFTSLQFLTHLGFTPENAALRLGILVSGLFPLVMLILMLTLPKSRKNDK